MQSFSVVPGLCFRLMNVAFFKDTRPWGFILFARNIESLEQVRALTDRSARQRRPGRRAGADRSGRRAGAAFQAAAGAAIPLGRGSRELSTAPILKPDCGPPGFCRGCMPSIFASGNYGQLPPGARCAVSGRARGHRQPRLWDDTGNVVAAMGKAACDGLKAGGMLPVIKHIPGHGRAGADTHFELPRVDAARAAELSERDFVPFKALVRRSDGNDGSCGLYRHRCRVSGDNLENGD
jgi:beta-N-acetylhexosaminidase